MHTAKVNFELTENREFERITELANGLLGAWQMNGQILGKQFPIAHTKIGLEVYINIPDSNSLLKKYDNKYVNSTLSKLKELDIIPKINDFGRRA